MIHSENVLITDPQALWQNAVKPDTFATFAKSQRQPHNIVL